MKLTENNSVNFYSKWHGSRVYRFVVLTRLNRIIAFKVWCVPYLYCSDDNVGWYLQQCPL